MHKISLLAATLLVSTALAGCTSSHPPAPPAIDSAQPTHAAVTPAEITGTLFNENGLKLPAAAVLTITLSAVESGNSATKVLAQKVEKLGNRTFPLHYQLPLDNLVITANSKAILTAAVSDNKKVIMTTKTLQSITMSSSQQHDLTLVPVANVAIKSGN